LYVCAFAFPPLDKHKTKRHTTAHMNWFWFFLTVLAFGLLADLRTRSHRQWYKKTWFNE
jgi:hypothetical protein